MDANISVEYLHAFCARKKNDRAILQQQFSRREKFTEVNIKKNNEVLNVIYKFEKR